MRMLLACLTGAAMAFSAAIAPAAAQQVDVEIVFLADSSGSIDDGESAFQRGGHAAALAHPDVIGAIRKGILGRIAVTYVEWGNAANQDVVVPWTVIEGEASAKTFGAAEEKLVERYEVISEATPCDTGAEEVLRARRARERRTEL